MFKRNKSETAKTNLDALSDQELIPALLEQVVGGAELTCFKRELPGQELSSIAVTCFKREAVVSVLDNINIDVGALRGLGDITALRG